MIFKDKKILIIDDNQNLSEMLKLVFVEEGAQVEKAANGIEGLQRFYSQQPDLVLLDVVMPEMDGWETCRLIRLLAFTPIIMLTTLDNDQDIVRGLENGADDFLTKPFSPEVLKARVAAVFRRTNINPDSQGVGSIYQDDYLTLDLENHRVMADNKTIKLSATEYKLLSFLFSNANRILRYDQILENVWGYEYRTSVDYVHVYISHLRRKMEKDPRNPRYFQTEHGVGYRFSITP
jgi:DNA-binding response OmpR family regulator